MSDQYDNEHDETGDGGIVADDQYAKNQDEFAGNVNRYVSSRDVCLKCLNESFWGRDKWEFISSIVDIHFQKLAQEIEENDRFEKIKCDVLHYCQTNNDFVSFWDAIKRNRPKQYEKYYLEWGKIFQEEKEVSELNQLAESPDEAAQSEQTIPASQEEFTVNWFYKELDGIEQSMVLTAALFQGVKRNVFNELNHNIYVLLFPETKQCVCSKKEDEEGSEVQNNAAVLPPSPRLQDKQEHFRNARLKIVSAKRNSEFSWTDVETVIFKFTGYRNELLKIIKDDLHRSLFDFILKLGGDSNFEKRSFAVNAVVALSETHLFIELYDIITGWAKKADRLTQQSAAAALSRIIRQEKWKKEAFMLINSWIRKENNKFLNITSILTYYFIADKEPKEAIDAIEGSLTKKEPILLFKINDVAAKVYRKDSRLFIDYIDNWMRDERGLLRQQAGVWFLRFVELRDSVTDDLVREKIVEIASVLWQDSKMPMSRKMQREMEAKMRGWAEEALSALENDEQEEFLRCQAFFYGLYQKCREELDYYVKQWQEYSEKQVDFSIIIPSKE